MSWQTITFKKFHEPIRMSTCPNSCPESSPTLSHMPKPNASKISSFQNKSFLFSKTHYRNSVKYWTTIQGELLDNALKQSCSSSEVICWTTLQDNSSENLPSKFLSQTFSFFFQFHVMHSLLIFYGAPVHMECMMPVPTTHANIFTCIYINIINSNKSCY